MSVGTDLGLKPSVATHVGDIENVLVESVTQ